MAGLVMLLACMMAETGTPCWREIISSVSPGATVIGVPPSQVKRGGGGGGRGGDRGSDRGDRGNRW